MKPSIPKLVLDARSLLGLHTQKPFADFLGVSERTVKRYHHRGGVPETSRFDGLIKAVYPRDPALAAELAHATATPLASLGLADPHAPPPPAPKPVPPVVGPPRVPTAGEEHATVVVCAAADALKLPPNDVRPLLATIFSKALELRVDLQGLAKLLAAPATKAKG